MFKKSNVPVRLNSYGLLEACCMLYKLQSLLARRSDLDWWLWADNSRGSFLLRVVSSRHFNCSNFQGFQDFKVCFLTSIYIFSCVLLCFIVSYAFFQADSPTALLSRASATKPSTLTGWVGVENSNLRLQIWKISAKVWCMPCGTKAVDGWIHLLWGLWGPPVVMKHDQACLVRSLSLLCSLAQLNDVAHCLSRFATEVQNRCQDSILLLFLRLLLCPSHPSSHGRCSGIAFAVLLFCNGGLARGLPADSFQ